MLLAGDHEVATGTATATLSVSATVVGSCIVSTTPVDFGVYDPLAASDARVQGTITLTCAGGTIPVVELDNGQFSASVSGTKTTQNGATVAKTSSGQAITRAMQNAGTFLGYDLFRNASLDTAWNATNTVSPGPAGSTQPIVLPVYGDIPARQTQTLKGGAYTDTVVVTVNF